MCVKLGGDAVELLLRAAADDDLRAQGRQLVRDAAPDAAAAARDPDHLACEEARPEDAAVVGGFSHRRCGEGATRLAVAN